MIVRSLMKAVLHGEKGHHTEQCVVIVMLPCRISSVGSAHCCAVYIKAGRSLTIEAMLGSCALHIWECAMRDGELCWQILATSSRAAAEQSQSQPPTQPPPSWPMHPPHLQPQPPSQPPPGWGMPPPMHMPLATPTLPPAAVQQGSWYQPHPMWPPPARPVYAPQYEWHQVG